jgi:hypothetical protein
MKNSTLIIATIISTSFGIFCKPEPVQQPVIKPQVVTVDTVKDNEEFLKILSQRESSGIWDTVGGANDAYIGLYQIGPTALEDIDMDSITVKKFKKNPNIFTPKKQKEAVLKVMANNAKYLKDYMKYDGKKIHGVVISKAGMLAGAHLVGYKAVKRFIDTGKISEDGFGTKVTEYFALMEDVEVNI